MKAEAGSGGSLPGGVYASVALLSFAVLALQIALNRIFSYTTWHHLAYISVSLALLGFGASGSVLAAFPHLGGRSLGRTLGWASILAAASTLATLAVVGSVPLHPLDALKTGTELSKLALYFGVISMPFFFSGFAITLALREAASRVNRLYFWDLVGAGFGCALVTVLLDALETPGTVLCVAFLFASAGTIAARHEQRIRNAALGVGSVALIAIPMAPGWLPFTPSRDKFIAAFAEEGTTHYSRWSSLFRTDLVGGRDVETAQGGYRDLGVSPTFEGTSPPFRLIFHDGTACAIMYQMHGGLEDFEFFRHHVLTAPYVLLDRPEVLVVGVGGGADVVNALVNGAARVVGAELDPKTVELVTETERDFIGGLFDRPEVSIHASEGRHFIRSTDASFDLIQLTGVDTLAALSSGAYVFSENYLYTVEAYRDYLRILRRDGLLSIAALDYHPEGGSSRHALRFAALSYEALRAEGIERPHEHVIVIGEADGPAEFEVLTKREPFDDAEITALERFADREGFQLWYLPHRPQRQFAPFRLLLEASSPERDLFLDTTFLDLRATTDDRPFFFSFYKWRHLFGHRGDVDPGNLLATGQLVLVLILALAALFSLFAIVLPLARVRASPRSLPRRGAFLGYFAALGAGFIFAEISFVQRFILFLGYPTYALSVILFSLLTSAGVGAYLSGRLPPNPTRVLPPLVGALTLLVVFYVKATPAIFAALLAAPLAARVAATVVLCVPLGALLGVFFPYGIRLTSAWDRDFTPWAWAVNGCFTVIGSVACIMLATTHGFTTVIALFLLIYWLGAVSFIRAYRRTAQRNATSPPKPGFQPNTA